MVKTSGVLMYRGEILISGACDSVKELCLGRCRKHGLGLELMSSC